MLFTHLLSLAISLVAIQANDGFVKVDFNVLKGANYNSAFERFLKSLEIGNDSRDLEQRDGVVTLTNQKVFYTAAISIGSQQSKVQVLLDTGSADLWVTSALNPECTTHGGTINCDQYGTFNQNSSTTFKDNNTAFSIKYQDKTSASGTWGSDSISLSDTLKLDRANFAVAELANSTVGVFGIGFTALESAPEKYINVPEAMKLQGLIKKNAYSLYLTAKDSATGSILFGGIDHAKYSGDLSVIDIVQENGNYLHIQIPLSSVTVKKANSKRSEKREVSRGEISKNVGKRGDWSSWEEGSEFTCSVFYTVLGHVTDLHTLIDPSTVEASTLTVTEQSHVYVTTVQTITVQTTSIPSTATVVESVDPDSATVSSTISLAVPSTSDLAGPDVESSVESSSIATSGPVTTPSADGSNTTTATGESAGPGFTTPSADGSNTATPTGESAGPGFTTPSADGSNTATPTGESAGPGFTTPSADGSNATTPAGESAGPGFTTPSAESSLTRTPTSASVFTTPSAQSSAESTPIAASALTTRSSVTLAGTTPAFTTGFTTPSAGTFSGPYANSSSIAPGASFEATTNTPAASTAATSSAIASSSALQSSTELASTFVSTISSSSSAVVPLTSSLPSTTPSTTLAISTTPSSSSSTTPSSSSSATPSSSSSTTPSSSSATTSSSSSSSITSSSSSSITSSSSSASSSSASSSSSSASSSTSSSASSSPSVLAANNVPVLFDSGTTLTVLPADLLTSIINLVAPGTTLDTGINGYRVPCTLGSGGDSLVYNFNGQKEINVPLSDLTMQIGTDGSSGALQCMFGIVPGNFATVGDNFLRSAYTVINLDDKTVSLAQINYSDDQNIVIIT